MPLPGITFNPTSGSTVYKSGLQKITVTVTVAPSYTITSRMTLTFSNLQGCIIPANQGGTQTSQNTFHLTPDPQNPQVGTVDLYIAVQEDPSTVSLTANPGPLLDVLGISKTPVSYTPHTIKIASFAGPDKTFVPVAPDNNQLPTASDYTLVYSITVQDHDNNNAPIVGGLVTWYYDQGNSVFTNMRAFALKTDTTPLTPVPAFGSGSTGMMVITPTDQNGTATLYLVSTTKKLAADVYAGAGFGNAGGGPFIVADLDNSDFGTPPMPEGRNGDTINFADIDGTDVLVHVSYDNPDDSDEIYLFINNIYSGQFTWADGKNKYYNCRFKKTNADTDTGDGGTGKQNTLVFVVATEAGAAFTSGPTYFYGKGNRGLNQPDPSLSRDLDAPAVDGFDTYINADILNQVYALINVKPTQDNWTPTPGGGDTILATIYLNGWNAEGGVNQPKSYQATYTISPNDITNNLAQVAFDSYYFDDWGPEHGGENDGAQFFAEYTLTSKDKTKTALSNILALPMDTVGPGSFAKARRKKVGVMSPGSKSRQAAE